jgi:hypothetical protein
MLAPLFAPRCRPFPVGRGSHRTIGHFAWPAPVFQPVERNMSCFRALPEKYKESDATRPTAA